MTQRKETAELMRSAVARLARRLRAERPADSLSSNKVGVLSHLHRHGPSSPGEIASAEHQQPQSLTRVFGELESAGLIRRMPNAADRRGSLLELTSAGKVVLRKDMTHRDEWLTGALDGLTDLEVGVLQLAAGIIDQLADS